MRDRLRALWRALKVVRWPCFYCHRANETSLLLWNDVKVRLICRHCNCMANYPEHIKPFDPEVRYAEAEEEAHRSLRAALRFQGARDSD